MPPASTKRPVLDTDTWNRVRDLFDRCQNLPPQDRARALAEWTADRPELREEVESLFTDQKTLSIDLDKPVLAQLAEMHDADETDEWTNTLTHSAGKYQLVRKLGTGGMAEVV